MNSRKRLLATTLLTVAVAAGLAGCRSKGDIVVDEGVGITAVRTRCPAVGVPDYTGDVTLFGGNGAKTAANIDVVAVITNVRSECNESGERIYARASFEVQAHRMDARGARQVTLPYFVTVLRGGSAVVTKRVGSVTLAFANGQARASARGEGAAFIDREAATLPEDIRRRITRKRKAGDSDAAIDPLSEPDVQEALRRANFELLVGFQLDENQLAYNATR